jgi:hypothetical protein
VSPTVLRQGEFRLYFFSREEPRMHVHVSHPTGEAKIWLEPTVGVASRRGLDPVRLNAALRIVREHEHEIRQAWRTHFPR